MEPSPIEYYAVHVQTRDILSDFCVCVYTCLHSSQKKKKKMCINLLDGGRKSIKIRLKMVKEKKKCAGEKWRERHRTSR